jgi:hypothetical protein
MGLVRRGGEALGVALALAVPADSFRDFRAVAGGRADDVGLRAEDRAALRVDTDTDAFGVLLVADFAFAMADFFVATAFFAVFLPALTFLLAAVEVFTAGFFALAEDCVFVATRLLAAFLATGAFFIAMVLAVVGFLAATAFFAVVLLALTFLLAAVDVFTAGFFALAEDSVFVATRLLAAFLATGVFFFATVFAAPTLPAGDFARAAGFFGDEPAAFFAAAFFAVAEALLAAVFFLAVLLVAAFFFAGVFVVALRVAMTCSLGAYSGLRSSWLLVPEVSGCSLEHLRTSDAIV